MPDPKAKVVIDADGADVLKEAKKITKAMEGLGNDVRSAFERGVADSGRLLTDLSERAGQVFGVLKNPLVLATAGIGALGAAAYKVGQTAVNLGGAFDKSMANVSTLIDTTQVNMEELGKQVLQTATDFRRSPSLVADALYEWISAGGRIDDGLAEFRESIKASVAGVTEAKVAVDGITTIMNAYGKEAGGAARVSDLMFQTVNKGKINFTELASQIGLVVSTAKGAYVPINDLMAAIATATAQGIRPSSAMEGLRSAISNIIKPSEDAKTTAKLLNLEWGVSALRAKGLSGLLKEVRERTKGNVETMAQLFGDVSGLNVVLALTGEGAGMFADNLAIMEQASGSTDLAFQKQSDTFTEVVAGLEAMGQAAATEIFNKFKPYLMEAGQWVIDNWPRVREQLNQTAVDLSGVVSLGLTPFRLAWEAIKGGIQTVSALLQGDFPGASAAAHETVQNLTASLGDFKAAWESISLPPWVTTLASLGITIGGAAAGIRLGTIALNLLSDVLLALAVAAEALAAGSLIRAIGQLVTIGGLGTALGNVTTAISLLGRAIVGLGARLLALIPGWGWIAAAVIAAVGLIVANWDKVGPFLAESWEKIKTAVSNGAAAVKTFLTETIPGWWEAFKTWTADTLQGIKTWFAELPGKLGESLGFVAGWLSVKIPEWWKAFGTWLDTTLTGISTWFQELPGKITAAVQAVGTWLATNIPEKWNAFSNWLSSFATELSTFFAELPGKFTTWLTNAVNAIPGLIGAFMEKGRQLAGAIWEGMKSSVTDFLTGFTKGFSKGKSAAGGDSSTDPAADIPQFALGGIVRRRMLAVVGEAGEEAIVPKTDAASWLPLIARWAGLATTTATPAIPALAGVAAVSGGSTINFGGITVILSAPPGTDNPQAWGTAAGDALFQRLSSMIKL